MISFDEAIEIIRSAARPTASEAVALAEPWGSLIVWRIKNGMASWRDGV
jgi:hypothetical protein